jgi:molybdopterin/thiamine biosynthesis adenylyltransferase
MAHILQVGAGSGGMVVLDLVARDPAIDHVTLVEPDTYSAHNVHRHVFPSSAAGRLKAELAADWLRARRPDLRIDTVLADITDSARHDEFTRLARECDLGICAVDNERAKFAFDALMRLAGKPWTLGEVLSGGIGGWVHRFVPDGPCYGCVASFLQRSVTEAPPQPPPDYANPGGAVAETTIPASKASIEVIASLHAVITLDLLKAHATAPDPFTSLLFSLQRAAGVFDEPFRSFRFRVERSPACLICSSISTRAEGDNLDVAVDQALGRLGPQ